MADRQEKPPTGVTGAISRDDPFDLELDGILYQIGACVSDEDAEDSDSSDAASNRNIRWVRQYIGTDSNRLVGPIVGRTKSTSNNLEELLDNLELDPPGFSGDYVVELLGAQPLNKNPLRLDVKDSVMDKLRQDLTRVGVAVCPDALPKHIVHQWRQAILESQSAKSPSACHWQENGQPPHIRSDLVQFIPRISNHTNASANTNTNTNTAPQQALDFLEHLVARVTHNTPYTHLWRPNQGMIAHYLNARHAHYTWHYDNETDQHGSWRNFRTLTAILYLNQQNPEWIIQHHGGALEYQYQAPNGSTCIEKVPPSGGTVVLFDSRSIRHCVSPAYRDRLAVTQWFVSPFLGIHDDSAPKGPLRTISNRPPSKRPPRNSNHDFCHVFNQQLHPDAHNDVINIDANNKFSFAFF
jgi:2OG-Fe(II) oxygenase superfamily